MKRKDLKVGEHYAVYSPSENVQWRRVARVEVLHTEPWEESYRSDLSRKERSYVPSWNGKGSGVHVRVVDGMVQWREKGKEAVVPLQSIREPWAEHLENEKKRKKSEEEVKALQIKQDEEWNKRVRAVNEKLIDLGITLSHWNTPERLGGTRKNYSWSLSMDEMERLVEAVRPLPEPGSGDPDPGDPENYFL